MLKLALPGIKNNERGTKRNTHWRQTMLKRDKVRISLEEYNNKKVFGD